MDSFVVLAAQFVIVAAVFGIVVAVILVKRAARSMDGDLAEWRKRGARSYQTYDDGGGHDSR